MNFLSFHRGSTLFSTMDIRCKCILVCLVSIAVLNITLQGNLVCLLALTILIKKEGFNLAQMLKQSGFFLIFIIIIFLSRWLTTPGDVMVEWFGLTLTRQGLYNGILMALRFFLILLAGFIFIATSSPFEIKNAAQWFLKPVPFVPEKRAALMIGLALGFLPQILKQAAEVSHAVNARCGNLRKNPVKRIINFSWPLLKKTFKKADDLTFAMEARCYSDERTPPEFKKNGKEFITSAAAVVFFASLILLS